MTLTQADTAEKARKIAKRQRAGIPINQCCTRADFLVGTLGTPMCRAHAGRAALEYLLLETRRSP